MDELLMEVKKNGGKLRYNLENRAHREAFFLNYGGEDLFRQECPTLYEALQRKMPAPEQAPNGGPLYGSAQCMEVADISYDNSLVSTTVKGRYLKKMVAVDLMGTFRDIATGEVLESMAVYDSDITEIEDTTKVNAGKLLESEDREFQTQAEFFYVQADEEGQLCAASQKVYSDIIKVQGKKYIVKKVDVLAPKPKDSSHTYTVLLYDRDADEGETADYPKYSGVRVEVSREVYVKIHIPAKITIELADDFEFIMEDADQIKGIYFPDFEMKISNLENGVVVFNKYNLADKIKVTYDSSKKNVVTYEFPDDWDHLMRMKVVGAKMIADFSCTIPIKCKHGALEYREGQVVIVVSSTLSTTSEDPANQLVKKIQIKFGCLAKDTKIRMKDGTEKEIRSIQAGELVLTESGGAKVTKVWHGPEQELVYVQTMTGKEIMMTESHPVLVKRNGSRQAVRAGELNGEDIFLTRDGEEALRYIYMKPYQDEVYNLELEGGEAMYANGFLVGDFEMQNQPLETEEPEEEPVYQFDRAQVELEMKRLLKLYQTYGAAASL